jgi:hypothetical protein
MLYKLPIHPSIISQGWDNADQDPVQADVIDALFIKRAATSKKQAMLMPYRSSLKISHGRFTQNGNLETGGLKKFDQTAKTSNSAVRSVINAARQMQDLFPDQAIQTIENAGDNATLNAAQVNSLLAHQVLGTLSQTAKATCRTRCFTSWYKTEQFHRSCSPSLISSSP